MESREMHQLQKLYIQETNRYLASLKEGVAGTELNRQKERIKELSRLLDQRYHGGADPASNLRRHHD
jgi:uncharacterized protein with von Willebrand factor type A (vWA) domain